jgi:hypothetical protein
MNTTRVYHCGCEKVDRCARDGCEACCYCGRPSEIVDTAALARSVLDKLLAWPTWAQLPAPVTRRVFEASRILAGESPGEDTRSWLAAVDEAMARAVAKHPRGPDGMRSLAEEVGEVASAMRREGRERVRAELIDVVIIALRWWEQLGKEAD